jgi:hypothetical protein
MGETSRTATRKDTMRKHQHPDDEPRRSLFRRFDDFTMRFYGPAVRSPRDLRGQDQPSEQTQQWYQDLQEEFVVEKDANGNTYLRPRPR